MRLTSIHSSATGRRISGLTFSTEHRMSIESLASGFETESMVIETLNFSEHQDLRAYLCCNLSLVKKGPGWVYKKEYYLVIRSPASELENGRQKRFDIEGLDDFIEASLEAGGSPTLDVFLAHPSLLDKLGQTDSCVHSAIVQHQLNQTTPPSSLPPSPALITSL